MKEKLSPRPSIERTSSAYRGTFVGEATANTDGVGHTSEAFGPFPEGAFFAVHDDQGQIVLSWTAGPVGAPNGDAPTGYLVQTSPDGATSSKNGIGSGTANFLFMKVHPKVFTPKTTILRMWSLF